MQEEKVEIINKLGLHARAAAKLVKLCSEFESTIDMEKEGKRVDCKSIMGVMMLAASCHTHVTVRTNGSDEKDAIQSVLDLINNRFGEEE